MLPGSGGGGGGGGGGGEVLRSPRRKYVLGKSLGKGSYASVFAGRETGSGRRVAVKVIRLRPQARKPEGSGKSASSVDVVKNEVRLMCMATHRNVVRLLDIAERGSQVFVVMEHMAGGDLYQLVKRAGPLPRARAARIFRQVLSAVQHCHALNICHRDLKPSNILLDRHGVAHVADFGLSRLQGAGAQYSRTVCGSPHYMAPELYADDAEYDGRKADVWSLGVVLYVMVTCRMPFAGRPGDAGSMARDIRRGRFEIPSAVDPGLASLVRWALRTDPAARPSVEQLLMHPAVAPPARVPGRPRRGKTPGRHRRRAASPPAARLAGRAGEERGRHRPASRSRPRPPVPAPPRAASPLIEFEEAEGGEEAGEA